MREITVRSMMGDYEGNAGLLSAWFDEEAWEWRAGYAACRLGPHHGWWVVHVVDLVTVVAIVVLGVMEGLGLGRDEVDEEEAKEKAAKEKAAKEKAVKEKAAKGVAAGVKEKEG